MGTESVTTVGVGLRHENLAITLSGETHEADFGLIVGEPQGGGEISAVVIPGYGETMLSGLRVVRALGEKGIRSIYPLLPMDKFPADPKWYEAVIVEGLQKTITDTNFFLDSFGAPSISHSGGSGEWALARNHAPELFGNAALLAPVGINALDPNLLRRNNRQRAALMMGRYIKQGLTVYDWQGDRRGNLEAIAETGSQVISDITHGRIPAKFSGMAPSEQNVPRTIIEHAAAGHKVSVTLGSKDALFPEKEACTSLGMANLMHALSTPDKSEPLTHVDVFVEDIPHVHFLMRRGVEQIQKAGTWLVKSYSHSSDI